MYVYEYMLDVDSRFLPHSIDMRCCLRAFRFGCSLDIYGLMHDAGLEEEDLNTSKASADIASSSSPQNAPSNASPSRKTEGVQL